MHLVREMKIKKNGIKLWCMYGRCSRCDGRTNEIIVLFALSVHSRSVGCNNNLIGNGV